MGKALKPLVIVLLLLGIVSLVLGILLFSKREILKERTRLHETGLAQIAEKFHYEQLNVAALKDLTQLQPQIDQMAVAANNMYDDLQNTKADLAATKQKLAETEQLLADTRAELEVAQNQIVQLNATIEQKDAEIAQANGRIDQLEQDKVGLQTQIDDLTTQLATKEDENLELKSTVATLEGIIDRELGTGKGPTKLVGLTGRILVVNPNWNFVVLDIGQAEGLVPNTELHVHRADQLVGKVRVSSVEENTAIANIVKDWEQKPVKEGDDVLIF
jgi:oligoribonuclease (3'-5' exoribonuclease)